MRAATSQQQQSRGGGQHQHPNPRSFSNAHNRKGSAASSASSSSAGGPTIAGGAGAATPSAANTQAASSSVNKDTSSPSALSLSSVIGSTIRLTLNAGARDKERPVVEGQLWCYDPGYGSLALRTPGTSANKHNYRIVRLSNIASVTVVQAADPETAAATIDVPLKAIDINRLQEREAEAVKEESKRIANEPPPGVSELGKSLYEALGKTLPVRWANKTM